MDIKVNHKENKNNKHNEYILRMNRYKDGDKI